MPDIEMTEEEQQLVEACRERGLPPSEVLGRATRDAEREQEVPGGEKQAAAPAEGKPVTAGEVKQILGTWDQAKTQQAAVAETRRGIEATIQGVIADSAFAKASEPKRRFLEARTIELARADPRMKSGGPDFNEALLEAANKAVAEEEQSIKDHGKEERREELESKLKASEKTGETSGGARSAGQGDDTPAPVLAGADMRFGAYEVPWPSDAELQAETHRAADSFLKKARG